LVIALVGGIVAANVWQSGDADDEATVGDGAEAIATPSVSGAPRLIPTRDLPAAAGGLAKIGQTQTVGAVRVTILSVRPSERQLPRVPPGYVRTIIEVTIENLQDDQLFRIDLFDQADLRDAQGRRFNSAPVPNLHYSVGGAAIPERGSIRGEMAYDVAQDAEGLEFSFIAQTPGGEVARVVWGFELPKP
jgi:hypothetical protein